MDFSQIKANITPVPKPETNEQSQPNAIKPLNENTNSNNDNDWQVIQPTIDENNIMTDDVTEDHQSQYILKNNKPTTVPNALIIESSVEFESDLLSIQLSSLNEQMKRDEKSLQQCDKQMKLQKMKIANNRMDEDTDTDEFKDVSSTTTSENNGILDGRGVRTWNGSTMEEMNSKWYQNRNTKIFISVVLIAFGLYIVYNKISANREIASSATASVLSTAGMIENGSGNDLRRPTIDWKSFLKPLERI